MSDKTGIEWTDSTWNPITGCTKISPGCAHCYAEAITLRYRRGGSYLPGKSTIVCHDDRLRLPLTWRNPRRVFVNSMSDLFHEDVPLEFIKRIFSVMNQVQQHTFQILTKRHERVAKLAPELRWSSNIWIGVSVENQVWADRRIPLLATVPASVRFLSCEPLLGRIDLSKHLNDVDWVIVGGESGSKARFIDPAWVRILRDQCTEMGVPFFFKQWGGRTCKAGGKLLDGEIWQEFPESLSLALQNKQAV